jgi:hypothetical protein
MIKEYAMVTAAKTKAQERSFQPFNVAVTRTKVTIDAVKNVNGSLSIDGSKMSPRLWLPNNR